jgi:hypothetical protein
VSASSCAKVFSASGRFRKTRVLICFASVRCKHPASSLTSPLRYTTTTCLQDTLNGYKNYHQKMARHKSRTLIASNLLNSEYIRKRENQKQAPPPPGEPLKRALHTSSQQQDAKSRGAATTALEQIFSWSREWHQSAKQMAAARAMASEPVRGTVKNSWDRWKDFFLTGKILEKDGNGGAWLTRCSALARGHSAFVLPRALGLPPSRTRRYKRRMPSRQGGTLHDNRLAAAAIRAFFAVFLVFLHLPCPPWT